MMSAQADQVCGADYGERSAERTNQRNGYRAREWDTRPAPLSWRCRSCGRAGSPRLVADTSPPCRAGPGYRGRHRLPAGVSSGGWNGWPSSWGSSRCPVRRSARWSAVSTRRCLRSVPGRWTPAVHVLLGRRADGEGARGRAGGQRARLIATGVNADGHREIPGWMWPVRRTERAGWRSCVAWSLAACPACSLSSPTPTRGWSRRSAPRCRVRPGSGVDGGRDRRELAVAFQQRRQRCALYHVLHHPNPHADPPAPARLNLGVRPSCSRCPEPGR